MTIYGEYTTVHFARTMYLSSSQAGDDNLILAFIRQASREIDRVSGRKFFPVLETRKFDTPRGDDNTLYLDAELLELKSITNGDGSSIAITDVLLLGNNEATKNKMLLLPTAGVWQTASGYANQAISITGVWAYLHDPTAGWLYASVVSEDGILIGATSFESAVDIFKRGDLLKIDNEFLYVVSAVSTTTVTPPVPPETESTSVTVDVVTIVRGVNGTVAAAHDADAEIHMWNPGFDIQMLAALAAISYYNLRSNPLVSSYTADGVTFYTPKDILKFIKDRLSNLMLVRIGLA